MAILPAAAEMSAPQSADKAASRLLIRDLSVIGRS
jgi:hypothetical protein